MSAGELRLRCRLVSLMSGKLRYPRSMQASCLGSPWQSLRSTDFPRLLEALTRWYCQVLTSLYFNAAITDVRSAKGSGQWAMKQRCLMIGSLFAEDKTQTMQSTGASLGLTHDLSCINKTGHLRFWARTRLHGKVRDVLPQHVKQATLLEAQLPNFMDLQTSWCKVFLGESGMAVSWPSRHATGALYGVVRLDRAPRPFSTSTWSLVPRQRCRSHDLGERAL